jgi:hypothetical protein
MGENSKNTVFLNEDQSYDELQEIAAKFWESEDVQFIPDLIYDQNK